MSGFKYVTNPNSLFVEDVDDETFLRNARTNNYTEGASAPQYTPHSTNPFLQDDDYEQQRQMYEQRRREIEDRTLLSSERSLGLLYETEQVGMATAEELARQREQLENTSKQLDDINSTLRFSQRHLTGLKSVFGGLKNYLTRQREFTPRTNASPSGSNILDTASYQEPPRSHMSPEERYENHPVNRLRSDPPYAQHTIHGPGEFSARLDQNLDCMAGSLTRLKGLAIDMNQEIDSQNDLIDNITNKVEDTDMKIGKQNRDMLKLLGKK
ncbi:synaptosomal-associated protein 29 [Phlebotomus argentipes]|uniref:synaptosomal-associated protein 29 n=1 Tax=Phlebotomus argentipes TaxID=94469 RepID=UPI002892EF2C|nr:synaptosomal-associated protein 29 [Phlebotomus argentipes]